MNPMNKPLRCAIALVLCMAPLPALATSFNCAKAHTVVERAICADPSLGALDDALLAVYKQSLATHPLPSYVKERQREWVSNLADCGDPNLTGKNPAQVKTCIRQHYQQRIAYLSNTSGMVVYSTGRRFADKFSDLVAEYYRAGGAWHLSIWGMFTINVQASKDLGKPFYGSCEFDGTMPSPTSGFATDSEGQTIRFRLNQNTFELANDTQICVGFSSLPDGPLQRVGR